MTIITNMNMGRKLSSLEEDFMQNQLASCQLAQTTGTGPALSIPALQPTLDPIFPLSDCAVIIWETQDAAAAWVTFMNTFDPPPLSIVVQTV